METYDRDFTTLLLLSLVLVWLIVSQANATPSARTASGAGGARLTLRTLEREPREGRAKPSAERLVELREAAAANPKDRAKRFDLVRALMARGELTAALTEASAWRALDAYNLVVVRLIGDIYAGLGDRDRALRTYSAVVELLPGEAQAQRALASVLKEAGELQAAYQRLLAAAKLRPEDARLAFELADAAHRLGRFDEAARRFKGIIDQSGTPRAVRYPAKQRLAQILAAHRRSALQRGETREANRLERAAAALGVKGGVVNDIKIYLTWDTDRSDVDLWVTNPTGQKIYYQNKRGRFGGALFDDVTTGYGPESFTARQARSGTYLVQVNYYGTNRSAFREVRGEVIIVLGEGTAQERRHILPYRLFNPKQTVSVARIEVSS